MRHWSCVAGRIIFMAVFLLAASAGYFLTRDRMTMTIYPVSDHYDGTHFYNPSGHGGAESVPHGFLDVMKWKFTSRPAAWPGSLAASTHALPDYTALPADAVAITYIGHASHLIRMQGVTLLTDPALSDRASPFSFIGPKRAQPPAFQAEQLPHIDIVLVSHNHYDHMDAATIRKLSARDNPLFITPLGNGRLLEKFGARRVVEQDWYQSHSFQTPAYPDLTIDLVPALHWSSRTPFDRNRALWGGFVVKSDKRSLYFAGDTGYGRHFSKIAEKYGAPDIAILPIGAYEPRWFMKRHHMNPHDAVQAFQDMRAKQAVATHYGTFQLTDEAIDAPLQALAGARQAAHIDASVFAAPETGETRVY